MAPLFPAFLLGLANERTQQEIGEWDVYSSAPSPPGCHGWLHLSKATAPVKGPLPLLYSLGLLPLPLPIPLPPGVVKASHWR